MISILICSRDKTLLNYISENVKNTIGVPYEIIAIDNSEGKYGICKAYNLGAKQAKYNIFCFIHEDITFETQNWGANIVNHLKDESVGLIGVVGADPMYKMPCTFAQNLLKSEANIIVYSNDQKHINHIKTIKKDDNSIIKQVTGIDGVFMCTRRDVYQKCQFDEATLKGFHAYDADFSLQILQKYKVCVVFDVLIQHFSSGHADKNFMDSYLKLCFKWKSKLPISYQKYLKQEMVDGHWKVMEVFITKLFELNYSNGFILKQYFYFSFNNFFRVKPFLSIFKSMLLLKFYSRLKGFIMLI